MAKQRVPRTHAGGLWTRARYFAFIRSALRRASMKYPVKFQVKDAVRRVKPKGASGRHVFEYQCVVCKNYHPDKNVAVDHIVQAGSLNCYEDLPGFVERLFCEADNLQVMCHVCHQLKTNKESRDDND